MTIREAFQSALGPRVRFDTPLAPFTTFRVGGKADLFVAPRSVEELQRTLALVRRFDLPWFVLGRGSNVLFSDAGFRGVVISFQEGFGHFTLLSDGVTIEAECGVPVSALVQFSRKAGLTGLEAAAGIPGSVGGACFMNAGTHEGNFAGLVSRLELIDLEGRRYHQNREELDFSYRCLALRPQAIILEAWLQLRPGDPETITKRIQGILQRRKASQPLTLPNAGSIFKNPPGDFAGRLVEAAGLKGSRIGDAQVSERHANFIVNRGNASAADIVALIELVRQRVLEDSGITLEPEVKVIGERGLHGH